MTPDLSRYPVHLGRGATAVAEPEFTGFEWYEGYMQRHASDGVALDHANLLSAGGNALDAATLDAEGGFVLLEWTGAAWQVIHSGDATITES